MVEEGWCVGERETREVRNREAKREVRRVKKLPAFLCTGVEKTRVEKGRDGRGRENREGIGTRSTMERRVER